MMTAIVAFVMYDFSGTSVKPEATSNVVLCCLLLRGKEALNASHLQRGHLPVRRRSDGNHRGQHLHRMRHRKCPPAEQPLDYRQWHQSGPDHPAGRRMHHRPGDPVNKLFPSHQPCSNQHCKRELALLPKHPVSGYNGRGDFWGADHGLWFYSGNRSGKYYRKTDTHLHTATLNRSISRSQVLGQLQSQNYKLPWYIACTRTFIIASIYSFHADDRCYAQI